MADPLATNPEGYDVPFQKDGISVQPSSSFLYEGQHIQKITDAVETHKEAFVGHILRGEVLKIFGCIRTDDSVIMAPEHL